MLRPLPDTTIATTEQIPVLQRLVTKIIKHEVARIVNHRLKLQILSNLVVILVHNALIKEHLGNLHQSARRLLLVVIDNQTCGKLTVIGVETSLHHRTDLRSKLVQLGRLDSVLNLCAYLLCDQIRVDVSKTVCEFLNTIQDLVEGHRDSVAVTLCYVDMVRHLQ